MAFFSNIFTKVKDTVVKGAKNVINKTKRAFVVITGGRKYSPNGKREINGSATAYTGGGRTSTGGPVYYGVIAVNPNNIPYRTKLKVYDSNTKKLLYTGTALDTGGAMRENKNLVDLYFLTERACRKFGRKKVIIQYQ